LVGKVPEVDLLLLAVFVFTILLVIVAPYERALIALFGVIVMVLVSASYTFGDAFKSVDWNVIMILFGMWMLSGYLSKSGLPQYVVFILSTRVGSYSALLLSIILVAGFITLFVDNVLVILLLGGLAVRVALRAGMDPLVAAMTVGLAANYMGTALLLGDLPPQMLHGVAGAEFLDFIWFRGAPSSLPLLSLSFILTLLTLYPLWFKATRTRMGGDASSTIELEAPKLDKITAFVATFGFIAFIVLASIRPMLGVELGALAVSVATATSVLLELLRYSFKGNSIPAFEDVLRDMEWRVIIFYISLFMLVGGLKAGGVIDEVSRIVASYIERDILLSYTLVYWATALLSTVVEHDAVILFLLKSLKETGGILGLDPWPHYWAVAWAGTLGSNATIAGAPALYLSLVIAEKARGTRISWIEWLKITIPFTIISLLIHYILSIIVVPYYID
jgi:Na+/H+ antiporter NhaD/arsenite permease-like protein